MTFWLIKSHDDTNFSYSTRSTNTSMTVNNNIITIVLCLFKYNGKFFCLFVLYTDTTFIFNIIKKKLMNVNKRILIQWNSKLPRTKVLNLNQYRSFVWQIVMTFDNICHRYILNPHNNSFNIKIKVS